MNFGKFSFDFLPITQQKMNSNNGFLASFWYLKIQIFRVSEGCTLDQLGAQILQARLQMRAKEMFNRHIFLFYSIFRTAPEVSSKLYFVEICQVSEKLWLFKHKIADFWLPNFGFKRSLFSLLNRSFSFSGILKLQLHDAIYRLRFYSNSLIHILSLSNSIIT